MKSPVDVAVTEVRRVGKVSTWISESVQFDYIYTGTYATATANSEKILTGEAVIGSSPPRGVFTSSPQNCSPI